MAALISRTQSVIRRLHLELLSRPLPPRLAIYFHEVEPEMRPAFRDMVEYLRSLEYRFVGPDAFLEAVDRAVYLSFDDNYGSWYKALPFLADLGVSATFYVNTCAFRDRATPAEIDAYFDQLHFQGERVPLSVAELRAIVLAGHVVGAHGHSHRILTALPAAEAREDIALSKRLLEDLLGQEVAHFSYPYGMRRHFNADLRAFCRSIGFRTVSNAIPGMQFARQTADEIQRSIWRLNAPMAVNLENLCADGRLFVRLTGRSALG
jgi:peptidoglycan/xylan/chitin deacetylase (PgdA/CDA1 family)